MNPCFLPGESELQGLLLLPLGKVVAVALVEAVLTVWPTIAYVLGCVTALDQTRELSGCHVALASKSSLWNLEK